MFEEGLKTLCVKVCEAVRSRNWRIWIPRRLAVLERRHQFESAGQGPMYAADALVGSNR
jgi:hypothetical protein